MSDTPEYTAVPSATDGTIQKRPRLGIRAVLGVSAKIFGGNFSLFTLLALLAMSPSIILEALRALNVVQGVAAYSGPNGVAVGVFILEMLLWYFAFAVLAHRTFMDIKGHKSQLGADLGQAVERLLPLVGLGIIYSVIVVLPVLVPLLLPGLAILSLIFVVPCIYAALVFFVVIPVAVIEKAPVNKCFGRSAALTKGSRWRILVLVMIILLFIGMLQFLNGFLFKYVFMDVDALFWSAIMVLTCLRALLTAYIAVLVTVTYHDLRRAKGDLDTHQPAMLYA